MAPITNARVLFNEIPADYPIPGKTTVYDTSETIDLETVPLNGGILVKTLVLSADPYMRGRMRDAAVKSYVPAFPLGQPLTGGGVGVVLRSEVPKYPPGSYILGFFAHKQYVVFENVNEQSLSPVTLIKRDPRLPLSTYLGAAGMPAETAYYAWKEYAHAKKGETVFVTTGAGPVGSMVIQIAKRDGLKVIASAGSEDKVAFMKSIGADVAFNYKTADTRQILEKEGPIDIFWDNVGGDILDAAMENANSFARIIECGQISGYNGKFAPMSNPGLIFQKCLAINGFLVSNLRSKWQAAFEEDVIPKVASGEYKYKEDASVGLEKVGDVILSVQKGTNTGKAIIIVAEE
ncbi:unnamed protein product [Mycena citricolor]|uniref:Enoyl reductase (ER) domain-containing protein n=1 Tax=Mycena citricolor TaxID=2018698 RepID=A0AAD2HMY8_9AGAR|nr:unnamed protein product [Mycena citricolor]CAK5278116.1 unnamed protein product [Mycena citricolor]